MSKASRTKKNVPARHSAPPGAKTDGRDAARAKASSTYPPNTSTAASLASAPARDVVPATSLASVAPAHREAEDRPISTRLAADSSATVGGDAVVDDSGLPPLAEPDAWLSYDEIIAECKRHPAVVRRRRILTRVGLGAMGGFALVGVLALIRSRADLAVASAAVVLDGPSASTPTLSIAELPARPSSVQAEVAGQELGAAPRTSEGDTANNARVPAPALVTDASSPTALPEEKAATRAVMPVVPVENRERAAAAPAVDRRDAGE